MVSVIYGILKKKKKVQLIETEQNGSCQGLGSGRNIKVEMFSYKMNKI